MPETVTVRHARLSDVEEILLFWTRSAEGKNVTDDAGGVAGLIQRDPLALLIAEVDGGVVGTVIAGWDGWRCHLYRLAVDPAMRREGMATLLLDHAEQRFRDLGGRRLDAMVLDGNDLAHSAWASAGYAAQPEWSRWVKPLK